MKTGNLQLNTMKLLFAGGLAFLKIQYLPNLNLLLWLAIAIVLDFVTGVAKAYVKGEARTSAGYRQTVTKFIQYIGAILAGIILAQVGSDNESAKVLFSYVNDGLIVFITYIEITSIFENLYAIDNTTLISQYLYQPALKILTFQLKNNPVIKEANALPGEQPKQP